jgi:hypothetical protein
MDHNDRHEFPDPTASDAHPSFWKSRAAMVLCCFLAIAGFLLVYEHRAHIFGGNGLLIFFLLLCPAMHLFMHHGHGGHGK